MLTETGRVEGGLAAVAASLAPPVRGPRPQIRLKEKLGPWLWMVPLLAHAADACAWGLYTHMYFTQLLLWAVPLADERFRRALRRFPELCLAATCLPDVSLFSEATRTSALRATHQWSAAVSMLRNAGADEERAMALGYASHLLADIVAHNYFVPAYQAVWLTTPIMTHAGSEWSMDAHVTPHVFVQPAALISRHGDRLSAYAAPYLRCAPDSVRRALRYLMWGERLLRKSRLPQMIYGTSRRADRATVARFDHYVSETSTRLRQINRLIAGEVPAWLPEIAPALGRKVAASSVEQARHARPALPGDFFNDSAVRTERTPPRREVGRTAALIPVLAPAKGIS